MSFSFFSCLPFGFPNTGTRQKLQQRMKRGVVPYSSFPLYSLAVSQQNSSLKVIAAGSCLQLIFGSPRTSFLIGHSGYQNQLSNAPFLRGAFWLQGLLQISGLNPVPSLCSHLPREGHCFLKSLSLNYPGVALLPF